MARINKKEKNIAFKEILSLSIINSSNTTTTFDSIIRKLGNIDVIAYVNEKVEGALSFRVKSNEYFIPVSGSINLEEEISKLKEELEYTEGFLKSVRKKLSNERFIGNAPEKVVAMERKKESDALAKIETIKESLIGLKG